MEQTTTTTTDGTRIVIDVVNFKIVQAGLIGSSYVMYMLCVRQEAQNIDGIPFIERRYTDFRKLHLSLRKSFPEIVNNLVFPDKLFSGNFLLETIARRSQAFEQYLSHLCDIEQIAHHPTFHNFFFCHELKQARRCFRKALFSLAVPYFIKILHIASIFLERNSGLTVVALCALSVCHASMDNLESSLDYCLKALDICDESDVAFTLPLLVKVIRLSTALGRQKMIYEEKLATMQSRLATQLSQLPSLYELTIERLEQRKVL